MTAWALKNSNQQTETKPKGFFKSLFNKAAEKVTDVTSNVAQAVKTTAVESAKTLGALTMPQSLLHMDGNEVRARREAVKRAMPGVLANAGVMMAVKSTVLAGMVSTSTPALLTAAATVGAATLAGTGLKLAGQAITDKRNGESIFTRDYAAKLFAKENLKEKLASQFKRAAFGGALGYGLHSVLSHMPSFSLVPAAHAAEMAQDQTVSGNILDNDAPLTPAAPQPAPQPNILDSDAPITAPQPNILDSDTPKVLPENSVSAESAPAVDPQPNISVADAKFKEALRLARLSMEESPNTSAAAWADLKGAETGNAQDIKDLAQRFHSLSTRGVIHDDTIAVDLYKKAALLNNAQAIRDLKYLERIGVYDPEAEQVAALNRAEAARIKAMLEASQPQPAAPTAQPTIEQPVAAPAATETPVAAQPENVVVKPDVTSCQASRTSLTIGGKLRNAFSWACSKFTQPSVDTGDTAYMRGPEGQTGRFVANEQVSKMPTSEFMQSYVMPKATELWGAAPQAK